MRKAEVSNDEIIDAGIALEFEGKTVTGYKLKNKIGRGRPDRLFEEWEKHLEGGSELELIDEIHILEPEIEEQLFDMTKNVNNQLIQLVTLADKKIKEMSDKKIGAIQKDFQLKGHNLCGDIDDLERMVGQLEIQIENLELNLEHEKSMKSDQFENEKTILKLRSRLQSKSELLDERQFRIDELIQHNQLLQSSEGVRN